MIKELDETIDSVFANPVPLPDSPFIIYGAGNCGRDVCRVLKENNRKVAAFLDARATSLSEVDGIPCLAPESTDALRYREMPVILGVFNNAADSGAIEILLRRIGFPRIVSYYEFFEQFPDQVRSRFWLAPRSLYATMKPKLASALAMLGDETSRRVFLETVELRTSHNLQLLRSPDLAHQYFPADLPVPRQPMRLIDGGCYIGDTVQAMLAQGFQTEAAACFEPEPRNFMQVCEFASRQLSEVRELCLFPCGLGKSTAVHRFTAGQDAASTISEQGNSFIQVVALDSVLPNFAPTFIKLDVEGAEGASLLGAEKTIRRFRPTVAVCLYHKPEDLWTLPALLREMAADYDFALRYHGFNGFEIVLYAIPR